MSIALMVPTRGRPEQVKECIELAESNAALPTTEIAAIVDVDDPTDYSQLGIKVRRIKSAGGGMGPPVNAAAEKYSLAFDILGFIGDDHRIRTPEWDKIVQYHLDSPGFLYGNDLARQDIPTQVFISSKIVRKLGWFCLPEAHHLYLDDTWAHLGRGAGCLTYDEKLIIEHMHPTLGKGKTDAGYQRVNDPKVYSHDGKLYRKWIDSGQAAQDIEAVKALR